MTQNLGLEEIRQIGLDHLKPLIFQLWEQILKESKHQFQSPDISTLHHSPSWQACVSVLQIRRDIRF